MAMTSDVIQAAVGVPCHPDKPLKSAIAPLCDLIPWLCNKSQRIFNSLKQTPDVIADIIRNCEFNVVEKDSVIIRQGDTGDCFYIILRGKVSVMINSENDIATELVYDEQSLLDRSQFGHHVTSLDDGNAFGELALLSDDCTRNATILADTRTDMIVISRDLYNRSIHHKL